MQRVHEVERSGTGWRPYSIPICLALLGGVASFVLFLAVRQWEQATQRSEFESWSRTYASSVQSTLAQYVGALRFVGDVYKISTSPVSRQQFDSLAANILPRYPGIRAFGWDPLVTIDDRAAMEAAVREKGFHDFQFTERMATGELIRAARRDEYVVVHYIYPLEDNELALGFDIASDATRLGAISRAFRTGDLAATSRITLVQEAGNQFGILLLMPVYLQDASLHSPEDRWQSRRGFVVEVLRVGDVIETALGGLSDAGIQITLHDMSADEGARLLYNRGSIAQTPTDLPLPEAEL